MQWNIALELSHMISPSLKSPALEGRFFTTGPPNPSKVILDLKFAGWALPLIDPGNILSFFNADQPIYDWFFLN